MRLGTHPARSVRSYAGVHKISAAPRASLEIGKPFDTSERVPGGSVQVAFVPHSSMVATTGSGGSVRLWDAGTQRQIGAPFPSTGATIESVAFSPDGRTLATGAADGTVSLWSVAARRQIGSALPGGTGTVKEVNSVAFNAAGTMVAEGDANGTVKVWNVTTRQQVGPTLPGGGRSGVNAVTFNRDGTILASAEYGTTVLWNVAALAGQQTEPPLPTGGGVAEGMEAVALGPAKMLVTSNGNVFTVWRDSDGKQAASLRFRVPDPPGSGDGTGQPPPLALSPGRPDTGGGRGQRGCPPVGAGLP